MPSPRRSAPDGWRPSGGRGDDLSIRSSPMLHVSTVGSPNRRPRARAVEDLNVDRTVYFSTTARARGLAAGRGGRGPPSSAALLLAAVNTKKEPDEEGEPDGLPKTEQLEFTEQLLEMAAGLFDSRESGDVTLHWEGGDAFHAHRAVLAGWSGVLGDVFRRLRGEEPQQGERTAVDLPYEGDPAALKSMVRAFYDGHVDVDVSEGGSAAALLATCLAYDVPPLVTRLTALLDANRSREQWWSELQDELERINGDGSMPEMWQRAQLLEERQPDHTVDRRLHGSIRTARMLRINLKDDLVRIVGALFDARLAAACSTADLSDTLLCVPTDEGDPKEFRVHRGVLGHWSGVLRRRLLQQRDERQLGPSRVDGVCKVNLEFRLRSHRDRSGREAIVVEQLLRTFYTGLLQLSSTENARELLQAAVAFEVPTVELAARTWLIARGIDDETVANVHRAPPISVRLAADRSTRPGYDGRRRPGGGGGPDLSNETVERRGGGGESESSSILDEVYHELDQPSGHGLSLHDVEIAIRRTAPELFSQNEAESTGDKEFTLHAADGPLGHGMDFNTVAKGVHVISSIRPGSTAAAAAAEAGVNFVGMQLLKLNGKTVGSPPGGPADLLSSKMASALSVKLTIKASKSSRRDWSVHDRNTALHWAYRAADEQDDGWISLSEFQRLHAYLRYVYDNFAQLQRVLDKVGAEVTFAKFQQACSMIQYTHGTDQHFQELCKRPTAIGTDVAHSRDFVSWVIRKNACETESRLEETHVFVFDKPGSSGITFASRTDEERSVETVEVRAVQQGSAAEAHPGLRSGMVLTSISSPALSTKQSRSERLLDWLSGDNTDAAAKLSEGAAQRIQTRDELERTRLREVCTATGLLASKDSYIGWDGLCHLGFKAVDNLLKQLFSTGGSTPITLGFAGKRYNLLFPGKDRCDTAFAAQSKRDSSISLKAIEAALSALFPYTSEDMPHKTIMQAYRAADVHEDGCLSKLEFQKCVQYLVYFYNNETYFEEIEQGFATEDRRQTLSVFEEWCQRMGEQLTHEEAVVELTKAHHHQDEGAQDDHTISYEDFCSWLARRAAGRMFSASAAPHRVHEVSYSGAAARTHRLTMPAAERIHALLDLGGTDAITEDQLKRKLSKSSVKAMAQRLFPLAEKKRLEQIMACAHSAAFNIQPENGKDIWNALGKEKLRYTPNDVISQARNVLRFAIALDDVWDKVSQNVQHRRPSGKQKNAGASSSLQACCAAPTHKMDKTEVMLETDFIEACKVAGYGISEEEAVRKFRQSTAASSFRTEQGHEATVPLDQFFTVTQEWINVAIAPQERSAVGPQSPHDFYRDATVNADFRERSGGRGFISASEARELATRRFTQYLSIDGYTIMLLASLEVCQTEHGRLEEHAFSQALQTFQYLMDKCSSVTKLLSTHSNKLNSGDFRRCCDLVDHQISDVQVLREFAQFDTGPEGYVGGQDFYVWFVRQQIEKSFLDSSSMQLDGGAGFPLLLLPPKSRVVTVAQSLANPTHRSLSWQQVQRGVAELLPQFHCDEVLRTAFLQTSKSKESIQADKLEAVLMDTSCLFKWWGKLQRVGDHIDRKDFWTACKLVEPDINREDAAVAFERYKEGTQVHFERFCTWALGQSSSANANANVEPTDNRLDVNAVFDRYAQDGAVDRVHVSKILDELYPRLHPHFVIIANKASSVHGKARVTRDACNRLVRCVVLFQDKQVILSDLYKHARMAVTEIPDRENEHFRRETPISKLDIGKKLYRGRDLYCYGGDHEGSVDLETRELVEKFWEDQTPEAMEKQQKDDDADYVAFGDFCCWVAHGDHPGLGTSQLFRRNTTAKSKSSLQSMSTKSLYRLGMQYKQGEHPVPRNASSAVDCFRAAADRRHAVSQRVLGECLMAGEGVAIDHVEAAYYYGLAAEQGDAIAQAHLGLCYLTGDGVEQDEEKAVSLFEQADDDPVAQFNRGVCLSKGQGVAQDTALAVRCYERAAKQGLPQAQCNLGECLMHGDGVDVNPEKAVTLFMQAAKRGLSEAQFNLGMCYTRGEGVSPDAAEGLRYYQLAAKGNHARAKEALARTERQIETKQATAQYQQGKAFLEQWRQSRTANTLTECIECFTNGAALGHADSQFELALMYTLGEGHLEIDVEEAYRLTKPAADANHADAAELCGQLLLDQWHSSTSDHHVFDEAVYYFTLAAESGHRDAQYQLGHILLRQACGTDDRPDGSGAGGGYGSGGRRASSFASEGELFAGTAPSEQQETFNWDVMEVVDTDTAQTAAHWFAKATEGGNVLAMQALAELYLRGKGVEQSDVEAFTWFRLAAEHNDAVALRKTAWLTLKGTGTHQDYNEAKKLFDVALENDRGNEEAKLAVKYFRELKDCARQSEGNYETFLENLKASVPQVHKYAARCCSREVQAQLSHQTLKYIGPAKYKDEIQASERARNYLSAEATDLSEKAEDLDAHRAPSTSVAPLEHVIVVSTHYPAVQLLMDSAKPSVETIVCDEADTPEDIEAEIQRFMAASTHSTLSSLTLAHTGELNDLMARLRRAGQHFGTEIEQHDMFAPNSDWTTDYFDSEGLRKWRGAAEKHEAKEAQKIQDAENRAQDAQSAAYDLEQKHRRDEDQRQDQLLRRRDDRKEKQDRHGTTKPWAAQHDPAVANSLLDFDDIIADDSGGMPLFKEPLHTCGRRMSSQPGLERLPRAIEACAEHVEAQLSSADVDVADLFKMPRNFYVAASLISKLDSGVDVESLDHLNVHVSDVAWVIVRWLMDLPQPLLSSFLPGDHDEEQLFERFQQVGLPSQDGTGEARAIADLKHLLEELPADHLAILSYIMDLLRKVELAKESTMMDATRISLAVTPALLRDPLDRETTRLNYRVVALMIEKFELVFFEQKLYPGTYSIEGDVSSIPAHGTLVLTDSHSVEGFVVVSPCVEPLRDQPHAASMMVRHIMTGGKWNMDGGVHFTARGPLKSEFRITVLNAQSLSESESLEMAVRVECEFGGHKMSSVTLNERIAWAQSDQLDAEPTGSAAWECDAGECLPFVARAPPSSFRLRCLGEGKSGAEELMGEGVVELEDRSSLAPAWVQELEVPITTNGQPAGTVQLVIEWDPAQQYQYVLEADENGNMMSADNTKEFTTSKAWAQDTGLAPPDHCRIHPHGSWHYARIAPMSTVTDRKTIGMMLREKRSRKDKQARIVVERLEDNEDGSKGAAEKAGVHRGDELLQVNGETVHTLSKANAIILQRSGGPGTYIEMVFSREAARAAEPPPAGADGSRRRKVKGGGCCGARPPAED